MTLIYVPDAATVGFRIRSRDPRVRQIKAAVRQLIADAAR